jgi:hypothetical protein
MPNPENLNKRKPFKKNDPRINKNGRPPKLIHHLNKELKDAGFEPAKISHIKDAYLTLINLPLLEIKNIASGADDDRPILYKIVAKELLGNKGADMLERLLDRSTGKATTPVDLNTKNDIIIRYVNKSRDYKFDEDGNPVKL